MSTKTVLNKIIKLYEGYSRVHRASNQPFHLDKIINNIDNYNYKYDDKLIREPLIEHVGSLPIVASTIFPYINDKKVDLGRSLIMLSIHDIGEIVVGDEITFVKSKDISNNEYNEAIKLIHPSLHEVFNEIENLESQTARFAKSIDKMAADIIDLMTPAKYTVERYKEHLGKSKDEIIPLIKEFKSPYMKWNPFIEDLHNLILERLTLKLK